MFPELDLFGLDVSLANDAASRCGEPAGELGDRFLCLNCATTIRGGYVTLPPCQSQQCGVSDFHSLLWLVGVHFTRRHLENNDPCHSLQDPHHSLNVGSMHPPQTQGKVQSAVRLALSGMYLLQASARTGLIDCQMTSKVPEVFTLPIMTGLER